MAIKESAPRRIFNIINIIILGVLALITVYPFINVIAQSFAPSHEILARPFMIFPKEFTVLAYEYIFSTETLTQSLLVSVFITLSGTFVNLVLTVLTAYPLAHSTLVCRRLLTNLFLFTMLFSGGMIPTFLLVKDLGLIDSFLSLILPGAISVYNMLVVKNFFQQLPKELEEAAKIDGANELYILAKVILPLSMPILATFTLFYAVGHWNSWFDALVYLKDANRYPLQYLIRQIIIENQMNEELEAAGAFDDNFNLVTSDAIKYATLVVSMVPMMILYPFVQKYFVQGVMVGSLKG